MHRNPEVWSLPCLMHVYALTSVCCCSRGVRVPQNHKNELSPYHIAMDTYSYRGINITGFPPNLQNNPHTIFQRDTHPTTRPGILTPTVSFGLDVAAYRRSPSPNHRKAHRMPSYLSYPAYVLSPPLPALQTASLSTLTTVAARYPCFSPIRVIRRCQPQHPPTPPLTSIEKSGIYVFISTV